MMEKNQWKTYLFWIAAGEGAGALSGWLSRQGTAIYEQTVVKPPFSPPGIVFPIVWAILFALMGISAARISLTAPSEQRRKCLRLFVLQLGVNFLWSPIFFNWQKFGLALIWLLLLWVLALSMIRCFYQLDPPAAWLQIPYLLWLTFAAYLNFGVWMLNR